MERMKEVYFDIYCPKCKHWKVKECENPCNVCLSSPYGEDSHKPLYYESEEKKNG